MSRRYPHPLIAREGWPFLVVAVLVSVLVFFFLGGWWSLPFWLAALFILQFFRDPAREVPEDPLAVVSPADGRVVSVGKARDPYLERDALKISVFMNVFNVHSNRSPVDGTVKPPKRLRRLPLQGAPLADRQSRIRGGRLAAAVDA